MRHRAAAALLSLFLGVVVFSPSFVLPQDQPDAKRKVVSKVVPVYPELARKMQLSGIVRVEAVVAPNGKLKLTTVIGGSPVLAAAAVDAIEKWKWAPAPQESKEIIELNFHP
ncbi:MAG: energy transducer TonB [Terriglobales bacterium]